MCNSLCVEALNVCCRENQKEKKKCFAKKLELVEEEINKLDFYRPIIKKKTLKINMSYTPFLKPIQQIIL